MKTGSIACISLLIVFSAVKADEAPAKAQLCTACHSPAAVSGDSAWPSLAGQKPAYLQVQLRAFRDGTRSNPEMAPFVTGISDAEIVELASYYAAQTPVTAGGGERALRARGENLSAYCVACHGMEGSSVGETWPNLAGQNAAYLAKQLAAYQEGARQNPLMQTVVEPFGADEFAALAAYYSHFDP